MISVRVRVNESLGAVAAAHRLDRTRLPHRAVRARDQAKAEIDDLDEEELGLIASEARAVASSLDEEGARLT